MRKHPWLGIGVCALVVSLIWFYWGTRHSEPQTVTIGVISPFSGSDANYGKMARTGIDLAVDQINAQGGIRGAKLVVQYEDDRDEPKDAVSAFEKLGSTGKVPAVIGPFISGNVLACAPVAEKRKVVLLTGSATSDNITNSGEYVFRVCPANRIQGRSIARFAYKQLGLKRCYVLYLNTEYGVTLRDYFTKAFRGMGGTVAGVEGIPDKATDVRAQLTKAKASSPDFIFAPVNHIEAEAILRQAKELGVSCKIIGGDGAHVPDIIRVAGNAADGSYWANFAWGNDTSIVERFREAYRKRYGEDPGLYSALYYDATHVLANAILDAKDVTGPNVRRALTQQEFVGATGLTRFDANGDVDKDFGVDIVRDGRFVPVSTLNLPD